MEPGTIKPVNWKKLNPEGKTSQKKTRLVKSKVTDWRRI